LNDGDLAIQTANGSFAIPASLSSSDPKSSALAYSSNKAGSAIAIAAAINSRIGDTGVNATANPAIVEANKTRVGTTSIQTDLYVNGEKVSLSLSAGQTESERRQYVTGQYQCRNSHSRRNCRRRRWWRFNFKNCRWSQFVSLV
jgi:hypothetical protein